MKPVRIDELIFTEEDILNQSYTNYPLKTNALNTLKFIHQWLSGQEQFPVHTSGSTGKPKEITISRRQMLNSARKTISHLALTSDDTAILCLDARYIAGIMMIVRAMAGNMQLVVTEPSGNPFKEIREIPANYFIAIVPYQAYHILEENSCFPGIPKAVLIGGGNTDHTLIQKIRSTNTPSYHSFGMTETVSHIALKRLDGIATPDYSVLEGIGISLDNRGCLVIDAPDLNDNKLITNDLIEITGSKTFRWLGRYDLVINSGGIKIHPEQVEEKIEQLFSNLNIDNNFFISSVPDDKLGEKVVLIMENVGTSLEIKTILAYLSDNLPEYHCPKEMLFLPEFEYTDTGKINRLKTRTQIL